MAETFAKCFDRGRLEITPKAAAILGKSVAEIGAMSLREFGALVFGIGCDIEVEAHPTNDAVSGKLTISVASEHERRRAGKK